MVCSPSLGLPAAQLTAALAATEERLAELDCRLARQQEPGQDERALKALAAGVQSLAMQLGGVNASFAGAAQALAAAPVSLQVPDRQADDQQGQARFEQRRQELQALLTAVERRGPPALAARAAALRTRIAQLLYQPNGSAAAARPALPCWLAALDDVFRVLQAVPDPAVQQYLAQTDVFRQLARQQVGRGLSQDDFEARRDEVGDLLDDVDRRAGDVALRLRVAALRTRLAALQPGTSGLESLRRERRATARLLARLRLEQELEATGERVSPMPIDAAPGRMDWSRRCGGSAI